MAGKFVSMACALSLVIAGLAAGDEYEGRFCLGKGNAAYLRLIDRSFEFFHPNPYRQNISMLYIGKEERLCENHSWYMWWIQNSYGPTFCALPFLKEPWLTALQNAQDLWFKFQGDGRRVGAIPPEPAPDGSLCDCAGPDTVIYKQGDMDWKKHDWFYEAAAAGVLMQAELLLISRDLRAIRRYLPHLERACNCVERRRDARNNLFLVGPASNLLAPSYGGVRMPNGTFGKGYLAGLSVTYAAALDRMIELYKLTGDEAKRSIFERRLRLTRKSLLLLMTEEGYFVKSIEPDGTKHGVYGQPRYGYFEVAPNVDAVCHRVVDDGSSRRIMAKICSIPELRPHGMLITNYPSLDDTYAYWGDNKRIEEHGLLRHGRWVNGGVWTTMEARAIMAYYRTGRYDCIMRSARAVMELAEQFQLDAPLQNFGKSVWFEGNPTNFCYDSLGVPAAVVRGLFEYVYRADSLSLYPHIHPSIRFYFQKEPIRFGGKRIRIAVKNAGPRIVSVKVNGKSARVDASDHVVLRYADLPMDAKVEIETGGVWPKEIPDADAGFTAPDPCFAGIAKLPEQLAAQLRTLKSMLQKIAHEPGADYERIFLSEAIAAFEAYAKRKAMDDAGLFREMDAVKRAAILASYQDAASQMYVGFETFMTRCAASTDPRRRRLTALFDESKRQ